MNKIFTTILFTLLCLNLSAQPQYSNAVPSAGGGNTYPFGQTAGRASNWLFPPGAFSLPGGNEITQVYFAVHALGSRNYTDFEILMAQTTATQLTSGQLYPGPWETVFSSSVLALTWPSSDTWSPPITLDNPFAYDPTKSLVVQVRQCGGVGSGMFVRQISLSGIHRTWSAGGCPFVAFNGGDARNVILGLDIQPQYSPQYSNAVPSAGGGNTYPFGQTAGRASNWLFPPGAFSLPGGNEITQVYFAVHALGSRNYTDFEILMAQTTATQLTSGQLYPGPWETVFSSSALTLTWPSSDTWSPPITLDNPFAYDPTKSLVVQVRQCGGVGSGMFVRQISLSGIHRTWSAGGCPFVAFNGGDARNVILGLDIQPLPPPIPTMSEWGIMAFALLLASLGITVLYRKRKAAIA